MSGQSGTTESNAFTRDIQAPEFEALRPLISGSLAGLITSGGGPIFGGVDNLDLFRVPISPGELEALDAVRGSAAGSPTEHAADLFLRQTLGGDFLDPESNPGLSGVLDTVTRRINEVFDEEELAERALFSRAGGRIQDSSPFARARAVQDRARLNAVGDAVANVLNVNFQREQDRRSQAVRQAREVATFNFQRAVQRLQAEALPRLIDQFGVTEGLQEFRRRVQVLQTAIGGGIEATRVVPGQFASAESKSSGGGVLSSKGGGGTANVSIGGGGTT